MRATPARVPSVLFSCRHSLYRFHSRPLPHSLLSLCSRSFFFSPFLSPRSFSRSACHPLSLLSVSLSLFLARSRSHPFSLPCSRSRSFRHRLPTAPSYPRGNPRTASVPLRHPPTAPTATTRVYKPDQPGSTYLPFRIIRLACRPLLHAEFRLIKMRLRGRGRARVVSARRAKTSDLNKSFDRETPVGVRTLLPLLLSLFRFSRAAKTNVAESRRLRIDVPTTWRSTERANERRPGAAGVPKFFLRRAILRFYASSACFRGRERCKSKCIRV